MIKGIGTDVVSVSRIKKLLEKHSKDRLKTIFTTNELKIKRPERLAGRFAAKEALSKAFGTGLGKDIWFSDIEIKNNEEGKPDFILNAKIKKLLKKISAKKIFLTISHEKTYAVAFVVIE